MILFVAVCIYFMFMFNFCLLLVFFFVFVSFFFDVHEALNTNLNRGFLKVECVPVDQSVLFSYCAKTRFDVHGN